MGQEPENTPESGQEPASTDEPVVKQTFDADYVKQLRAEAASHRKEAQEVKQRLQELEDRDASELEKAQNKVTKEAQRAEAAEARLTRYEVAAEKQVPAEAVELLTGSTREELEAQADKILSFAAKPEAPAPEFDGGAREPAPEVLTPEQSHNRLFLEQLGLAPK